MKKVELTCPKCNGPFIIRNYFIWILKSPFHWFGKRLTRCPWCGEKSYMKRER